MPKRFITIKDIARELKISVATVSRALRNTYDVSQETREKVLSTAARLNYRPNASALGLVQRQTHNIGVIIPSITNYYFSTVITGIQECAIKQGYNIILYITNDLPEIEKKLLHEISLSNLDGILVCLSSQSGSFSHFQKIIDDLPCVFFDRVPDSLEGSKIVQDDYNGAMMAVEHLIACGYQRIAHITGPENLLLTRKRLNGYLDALEKHNLRASYEQVRFSGFSQKEGENDTISLFKDLDQTPDAIFAVNDRKGVGAIISLRNMGIAVGKEVGVIGFTNDPISEIISPRLSTIAEPAYEIGKMSCEILLGHIKKPETKPQEIILSGDLVKRESTMKGIEVTDCRKFL
jgi:DNA-binding LacI/PurR family transcriptional regulator